MDFLFFRSHSIRIFNLEGPQMTILLCVVWVLYGLAVIGTIVSPKPVSRARVILAPGCLIAGSTLTYIFSNGWPVIVGAVLSFAIQVFGKGAPENTQRSASH